MRVSSHPSSVVRTQSSADEIKVFCGGRENRAYFTVL